MNTIQTFLFFPPFFLATFVHVTSGMFPQDSHGLSSYVNSIFFHYAQKRRIDLLSKAREILQSDDRNTTQVDDSTERGKYDGQKIL